MSLRSLFRLQINCNNNAPQYHYDYALRVHACVYEYREWHREEECLTDLVNLDNRESTLFSDPDCFRLLETKMKLAQI